MAREVVRPELFEHLLHHPNLKGLEEQSLRTAIYRIRKANPGVSMNAAAYEYARKKKVSVFRYLTPDDKQSLRFIREDTSESEASRGSSSKARRVSPPETDYSTPFASDAYINAQSYPYVFILENSLRWLISTKYLSIADWWKNPKYVSPDIQDYATKIQDAEKKYGWLRERGNHPIYYVSLNELYKIIERNWSTSFRDVFSDLGMLSAWIKECVPIRNQIAHNVKTRKQERDNLRIRTDYICRLIENWAKTLPSSTP